MRKDTGSFASKQPQGEKPNPKIADAVKVKASGGEFSCIQAEKLTAELQVAMESVGITLDLLEIRIANCQHFINHQNFRF